MKHFQTIKGDKSRVRELNLKLADTLSLYRYQLIGGFICSIILPTLFHGEFSGFIKRLTSFDTSIIGMLCAFALGYRIMRKMTVMPTTLPFTRVFPAFALSYSIVTTLFSGLRIEFSRWQFAMSFLFIVLFFIIVLGVTQYISRNTIGIIDKNQSKTLTSIDDIQWIHFQTPKDAEQQKKTPIVADLTLASDEWVRYLSESAVQGRRIFDSHRLHESLTGKVKLDHLSENSMGHLAIDSLYAPSKNYLDFVTAFVTIIMFSPLLCLLALLIKIESKGPAIFKQSRIGWKGTPFTVYKFRSMYMSEKDDRSQLQNQGVRITKVGKFIRNTRIDELPQLFNILKGEMSWIGPRPESKELSELYEEQISFYRYRHVVKPGITGWAQVNQGHVTKVSNVREKLRYDFYYIKHFSVWLDIIIIFKTMRVVVSGFGAK